MRNYMAGAALAAIACATAGPAHAQDEAPNGVTQAAPQPTEERDQAQDAGQGEILVVAQRRTERLQDVPIAITALSAEDLAAANIQNALDLTRAAPGFVFNRSSYAAQPTVRGIATRNAGAGDESNIAFYVDGVYQSKIYALFMDLTDVESVQVLRGPQGTLFGRNATGGAVILETRAPSDDEATATVDASYGNYDAFRGHVYLNVPIADGAAFNVSAVRVRDDGYTRNIVTGERTGERDAWYVRARARFDLGADTTLTFSGNTSRDRNDAFVVNNSPAGNNSIRTTNPTLPNPSEPYTFAGDAPVRAITEAYGASYRLQHDFSSVQLTATGAYEHGSQDFLTDSDRSTVVGPTSNANFRGNAFSQELLVNSTGGSPLQWTAGVYLFWGSDRNIDNLVAPSTSLISSRLRSRTQAVFGELTYRIGDHFFLTAGGRFNHEKRLYEANRTLPVVNNVEAEASYDSFVPRFVARYEFSDDFNVYASYSQGFKSGVFNSFQDSTVPVEPERLYALEGGFKARLFDRRVQFDLAAYRYSYRDIQVSTVLPDRTTLLQNAAAARIYGLDADIRWRVTDQLDLRAGAALIHARYLDYPGATGYTPIITPTGPAGNTSFVFNAEGKRLSRTPDYTFNIGAVYRVPVGTGEIQMAADVLFSDGYYFDLNNRLRQPAYELLNASLTYRGAENRWFIGVYGDNLTDSVRYGSVVATARGDTASYLRPRSYGIRAGYTF